MTGLGLSMGSPLLYAGGGFGSRTTCDSKIEDIHAQHRPALGSCLAAAVSWVTFPVHKKVFEVSRLDVNRFYFPFS